jgi:hypothetical protein
MVSHVVSCCLRRLEKCPSGRSVNDGELHGPCRRHAHSSDEKSVVSHAREQDSGVDKDQLLRTLDPGKLKAG